MNIPLSSYKTRLRHLALPPGVAISVEARAGTELRSLEGVVWVTQEGDVQDYIVPVGMRFTADRAGYVVISAVCDAARIAVSWSDPAAGSAFVHKVSLDYASIDRLERTARLARSREIARLIERGWAGLARAWRSALASHAARQQVDA